MNLSPSLNEIISQQAVVFADQIKQAAAFAADDDDDELKVIQDALKDTAKPNRKKREGESR